MSTQLLLEHSRRQHGYPFFFTVSLPSVLGLSAVTEQPVQPTDVLARCLCHHLLEKDGDFTSSKAELITQLRYLVCGHYLTRVRGADR